MLFKDPLAIGDPHMEGRLQLHADFQPKAVEAPIPRVVQRST